MSRIITVDGLGKRYQLGKQRLVTSGGLGQLLSILGVGQYKKELTRELTALSDVSFSVEQGEVLGIIGHNGAGKSTLLKILARITLPTTGKAIIHGRVVSLLELGAGFHPELTGRENIFLNAAFYGITKAEVARELDEIISFAQLEEHIDTPVRHYSSGMYVRLAFSNAIHMRPDVLLADEVLAVGDLHFQQRCMEKMQEISRAGITILFVSHDMEAVGRMCDRCIRLDRGRLVDEGLPADVIGRYRSQAYGENDTEASVVNDYARNTSKGVMSGKFGEFLSVELRSLNGLELGVVRTSVEFELVSRVRVDVDNVRLFASFDITVDGVIAFRAVLPSNFYCSSSGIYEIKAKVPANLLAEVSYVVNAAVHISTDSDESTLIWYEALSFRVYATDDRESARGEFVGRMPGLVMPRLLWTVTQTR